MKDDDDLMRQLLRERLTNPWWKTPAVKADDDSELTCARRRRELLADDAAWRAAHGRGA